MREDVETKREQNSWLSVTDFLGPGFWHVGPLRIRLSSRFPKSRSQLGQFFLKACMSLIISVLVTRWPLANELNA
jgi:hypothetical protein